MSNLFVNYKIEKYATNILKETFTQFMMSTYAAVEIQEISLYFKMDKIIQTRPYFGARLSMDATIRDIVK